MMLRSKLATVAGALLLAGSAFALQEVTCPDINDIKAEGISMAEIIGIDSYIGYNISTYNTASLWGFVIAPIDGDSEDTAIENANEILSTMSAPGVPNRFPDQHSEDTIYCSYDTGLQGVVALALKDNSQMSPVKLKQLFKQVH